MRPCQADVAGEREEAREVSAKKGEPQHSVFGKIWERFGEVAKRLGLVGDLDVMDALSEQERMPPPRKRIGEILVDGGKLSADHVEQVLQRQRGEDGEADKKAGKKPEKKAAKKPAKKKAAAKAPKKAAKKPAAKKKKK
jgi:hypothetical protein